MILHRNFILKDFSLYKITTYKEILLQYKAMQRNDTESKYVMYRIKFLRVILGDKVFQIQHDGVFTRHNTLHFIDQSSAIKNEDAQITKACLALHKRYGLCLSGTPAQVSSQTNHVTVLDFSLTYSKNSLTELKNQLSFIGAEPDILGDLDSTKHDVPPLAVSIYFSIPRHIRISRRRGVFHRT